MLLAASVSSLEHDTQSSQEGEGNNEGIALNLNDAQEDKTSAKLSSA
jgi:hypothetical protein